VTRDAGLGQAREGVGQLDVVAGARRHRELLRGGAELVLVVEELGREERVGGVGAADAGDARLGRDAVRS
jgi:hypothetical protein